MKYLIAGGIVILLALGGGFLYEYIKRTPPDFLISLVTKTDPPPPLPEGELAPFTVPEGFVARIFARDLPGARVMIRDQKGTLLVSQTEAGRVVALPDLDQNGVSDETVLILEGLHLPHGLIIRCPDTGNSSADQDACTLYVAETNAVRAYRYDADTFTATLEETIVTLPAGRGHFTRTLLMHPDDTRLLVSVGSSCNVCEEEDAFRAAVIAVDVEANDASVFAEGLRNTVFMAVHPETGEVWGTDNGRDLIGDDIPPDEVNIIREGFNYGWPICYGDRVHDTDFDSRQYFVDPCHNTEPPHIALQAHSAALGLAFIPETGWPEGMQGDILIAYHGSWNRSTPTGYKVVRFDLGVNGTLEGGPHDFMTGFLPESTSDTDNALGRPVDVLIEQNGVVFVSDDRAGAVYRISRE